jgi:septum site-determining protein MinC
MSEVLYREEKPIDIGALNLSENYLFELSSFIEEKGLQGKVVRINLGDRDFSQNYLENMLSVLKGYQIEVEMVYSTSKETKIAALEAGLTVSGQLPEIEEAIAAQEGESSQEKNIENINWEETPKEEKVETLYIKQNLRSGQKIEFDGNIVLIGDCNAGSEIIASGDIIIWGVLSGIAHAGNRGNKKACIRAFRINAIQIRIADLLARKPDRIDMDRVDKSDLFNPEEAKISDGEIVIYSAHQEYY